MRKKRERGMTLVELLLAITGMAIISAAATYFLSTTLDIEVQGSTRSKLYREGLSTMEKMKQGVKRCTYLHIPNSHNPTRDILAFSGTINEDNDFYFGDPLFPRIDEDIEQDSNQDTFAGIGGLDDDGDASIDEGNFTDDDEDGSIDEDPLDGIDNDSDGNTDEDTADDANADNSSGIQGMDDDGDGLVDESNIADDDEDGNNDEDTHQHIIYSYDNATNTLTESIPWSLQSTVISDQVTFFQVTYEAPQRILIELTLTGDDDSTISFSEYVYLQNTFQKLGKRVR
jgi:type II secretory pathway pseudopilin PulG